MQGTGALLKRMSEFDGETVRGLQRVRHQERYSVEGTDPSLPNVYWEARETVDVVSVRSSLTLYMHVFYLTRVLIILLYQILYANVSLRLPLLYLKPS